LTLRVAQLLLAFFPFSLFSSFSSFYPFSHRQRPVYPKPVTQNMQQNRSIFRITLAKLKV
jgi:hypothetical protein